MFENEDQWKKMIPRELIIEHISSYVRFNLANPQLLRMVMFESIVRNERFEWFAENVLRPFTDRSINRVDLAQKEGVYRNDIPALNLHYMSVAASRSMVFAAPELDERFGINVFAEEEIQRHVDGLVKIFVLPEMEGTD